MFTLSGRKELLEREEIKNVEIEKVVITQEISLITTNILTDIPIVKKHGGIEKVPRNSYLGVRVSDSRGALDDDNNVLLYPFFSSHFILPLKVGETAWVLFDRKIKDQGFWISRCHSNEDGEDLNYSHYDRRYVKDDTEKGLADRGKIQKNSKVEGLFPDMTFPQQGGGPDKSSQVFYYTNSIQKLEPVPRFTPRSGDLVINGSNNAMICLGTDRYWTREDDPSKLPTNASFKQIDSFSGTVDIVAGRSRYILSGSDSRTSPSLVRNSRGFFEVAKSRVSKSSEGDPDTHADASRIYVSMKTEVDNAFSLSDYIAPPPFAEEGVEPILSSGAAVAIKSDHIRIIARKDEESGIDGTIRIIKEGSLGNEEENDGSSINMLDDGTVHVAARKIYLGLSTDSGGVTGESSDDISEELRGERQPYIRYQELKALLKHLLDELSTFRDAFNSHVDTYNAHTHSGTGVGIITPTGAVSVTTLSLFTPPSSSPYDAGGTQFEKIRDDEIETVKSTRIFGE